MKKILFLLSFATIASPVRAGTFEVDYGLDINSYYGYTDYSKPYNKMYKQNNLNSSFNAYGRITYEFNKDYAASLVGYLMVDTAKEIENYNQGIWGEEIYSAIETPAGEFSVGQDYNVAYKFAVGAPNIGKFRINNTDIANFIINPNWYKKGSKMSYKTLNSTYINTDGASPKINYITPAWKGIKLGATFIPETYSQAGLVAKDAPYKDKSAYVLGAYGYWYLSGYELETSLGFADYDKNDKEVDESTFTIKELITLSEETKDSVIENYKVILLDKSKDNLEVRNNIDSLDVSKYCGVYNGYYAIRFNNLVDGSTAIEEVIVGDYTFHYPIYMEKMFNYLNLMNSV